MKTHSKRFFYTLIGGAALVMVLVFGGAGVTAYAAQSALPGDALYPVKTSVENTRIRLAGDPAGRAQLQIGFAAQRLDEITQLISEGRYDRVSQATASFDNHIRLALQEAELAAASDAQHGLILTARISETLSRYGRVLSSMLPGVPEPVRVEMQQAIDSSLVESTPVVAGVEIEHSGVVESITAGAWIVGGKTFFIHSQTEIKDVIKAGDFVKVHASVNGDGDLVAREIELSTPASLIEDGGNTNLNGNLNGNLNSNDDSLAPGNLNSNANSNDDNGGLMNSNGNTNTNQNTNNNSNDDNGGNSNGSDDGGSSGKGKN